MRKGIFGGDVEQTEDQVEDQARMESQEQTSDTDKVKEGKRAAAKRMLERKRAALDKLIALGMRLGDDEEKKAAEYLTPGRHVAGTPAAPKVKKDMVAVIFGEESTVHEDKIFMEHKLGRPDMAKLIKQAVNQNIWISFDAGNGVYTVQSRSEMPEGWLGPLPKPTKVE